LSPFPPRPKPVVISTNYLTNLLFFVLDADDEPVHSLKAVVTDYSSIVLTWEKPSGVSSDKIKVCTTQMPC